VSLSSYKLLTPSVPELPDDPAGPVAPFKFIDQLVYVPEPSTNIGFIVKEPLFLL